MSNIWMTGYAEKEKREQVRRIIHQGNNSRKFPRTQNIHFQAERTQQGPRTKQMTTEPRKRTSLWNSEPGGQVEDSICFPREKKIKCEMVRCMRPLFLSPGFAVERRVTVQWGGRGQHASLLLWPGTCLSQPGKRSRLNKPGCMEWFQEGPWTRTFLTVLSSVISQ